MISPGPYFAREEPLRAQSEYMTVSLVQWRKEAILSYVKVMAFGAEAISIADVSFFFVCFFLIFEFYNSYLFLISQFTCMYLQVEKSLIYSRLRSTTTDRTSDGFSRKYPWRKRQDIHVWRQFQSGRRHCDDLQDWRNMEQH